MLYLNSMYSYVLYSVCLLTSSIVCCVIVLWLGLLDIEGYDMVGDMYMKYISIENIEPNSVFSLRLFHYHISAFLSSIMTK